MWRSSAAIIAAAVALSMGAGDLPAAGTGTDDRPFYLSLGDSLATGCQPGRGPTRHGYVEGLWRTVREQTPALSLRKLGCPGETSLSMINGKDSLCDYSAGSQLEAAVRFLGRHPDQVSFVTIDIGANESSTPVSTSTPGCSVGLAWSVSSLTCTRGSPRSSMR